MADGLRRFGLYPDRYRASRAVTDQWAKGGLTYRIGRAMIDGQPAFAVLGAMFWTPELEKRVAREVVTWNHDGPPGGRMEIVLG